MTEPQNPGMEQRAAAARDTARREAQRLARDTGADVITRPVLHGGPDIPDVEPLAGAAAARILARGGTPALIARRLHVSGTTALILAARIQLSRTGAAR